jgi:integrase
LIEAEKGRTAAKVRASLRAAFETALKSGSDAAVPASFAAFGIQVNPVAATASLSQFNATGDRTLDADELRGYIKALRVLEHPAKRCALLAQLYLGGQRTDQLIRVTRADVDLNAKTIRLYDPKGRRQQPRVHVLPMTPTVLSIVRERIADGMEPDARLFPVANNGKRALSAVVGAISDGMKSSRGTFQLRDIRRTCETMMAAIGVSKDIRAQIQSHGLGGVQALHYDRHDYATEKSEALGKWGRHLQKVAGKR